MSGQRVLDKLANSRNAQSGESSRGDGDQERKSDMGGGDFQSVEDVLCFDRRTPLATTALGLMGFQMPQVGYSRQCCLLGFRLEAQVVSVLGLRARAHAKFCFFLFRSAIL